MHSVRQTSPKLGSCKPTTRPGKEVGGEKWQARDKGLSEGSRGGDKHWQSRFIAKSEDGADMGFGMITSGRALWSRAGKFIMPKFFLSLSKLLPPWLLVYLQLYSCTTTIILLCVCVNALEAKFLKGFYT